ncbi:MAG: potassium-transporting ATPase subunit F [Ferrimicrobium sp.]
MTVSDMVLLVLAVVIFGYVGVALFKPEWF